MSAAYAVRIQPDGDRFLAQFRDIPEALTGGDTVEEALKLAADALVTAMDFYFEDRRTVPAPSAALEGEELVELPASLSAKILLLNEMVTQQVKPAALARKLHTTRQAVDRLTNLKNPTKIDNIAEAFKALGKDLVISVA